MRAVVFDDSLGIGADLDAAMAAHVDSYEDEWAATLDDPEKLAQFVSFVNAPETRPTRRSPTSRSEASGDRPTTAERAGCRSVAGSEAARFARERPSSRTWSRSTGWSPSVARRRWSAGTRWRCSGSSRTA